MTPEEAKGHSWRDVGDGLIDRIKRVVEILADALERALMFVGCLAIHTGVHFVMERFSPKVENFEIVQKYLNVVVYGAFFLVYAALLYEFVAVFVPFLRPINPRKSR